uniref:Uncharacterized protein n=2 Tax=Oryza TaxID=4527 RepID=A0A0E0MYC6_ORYRU
MERERVVGAEGDGGRPGRRTAGRRRRRIAHGAAGDALRVGAVRGGGGGLDFFASRSHAAHLIDLVTSPWPGRVVASKHAAASSRALRRAARTAHHQRHRGSRAPRL